MEAPLVIATVPLPAPQSAEAEPTDTDPLLPTAAPTPLHTDTDPPWLAQELPEPVLCPASNEMSPPAPAADEPATSETAPPWALAALELPAVNETLPPLEGSL